MTKIWTKVYILRSILKKERKEVKRFREEIPEFKSVWKAD